MKLREFDDLSSEEGFEDDRIIRDDPFVEAFGNPSDFRIDRSKRYDDDELRTMSIEERYQERQRCAKDRNIFGMIDIFSYDFKKFGVSANGDKLIALSFLYGRTGEIRDFEFFIEDNRDIMLFAEQETVEISNFMLRIGLDYPDLNDCQLDYLEMLYNNKKYCSIIDELLFDKEKLPRVITGITREQLKIKYHQ